MNGETLMETEYAYTQTIYELYKFEKLHPFIVLTFESRYVHMNV